MRQKTDILESLREDPTIRLLCDSFAPGAHVSVRGSCGSSTNLIAGAIAANRDRCVVLVTAHLDDADECVEELTGFGVRATRLPALEFVPGESALSTDLLAERLGVVRSLLVDHNAPAARVLACPVQALMQGIPEPASIERLTARLAIGEPLPGGSFDGFLRWLESAGFARTEVVQEPGEFAVRGGIVDLFGVVCSASLLEDEPCDASGAVPMRIDLFGDDIETISEIDLETMGSGRRLARVVIAGIVGESVEEFVGQHNLLSVLPPGAIGVIAETMEVVEQARGYFERVSDGTTVMGPPQLLKLLREQTESMAEVCQFSAVSASTDTVVDLPVSSIPDFSRDASEATRELCELAACGRVRALCQNEGEAQRLSELIKEFGGHRASDVEIERRYLHRGFTLGSEDDGTSIAVVPYHELLHRYQTRRRIRRIGGARAAETFYEIEEGDYVVHADHGIGVFRGMRLMEARRPKADSVKSAARRLAGKEESSGPHEEFLTIEFASRTKLHVPISQIDKIQKYVGGFSGKPRLSTLGGKRWSNQKDQVREAVRDLASELLRVQAARESLPGVRYPQDTPWQNEFEAEFPYEETVDQLGALRDIKKDMTSARPMDRLVCGDVGYGKTEVAIRAAFKAVEFGKQVGVLVPTTLLAEQHERTFRDRFADYPFTVESLSRFRTGKQQKAIVERTREGRVDILIGTHRLLSSDVRFRDLGLVIVDEEQRFGVEHKNALLRLRLTADVLTLSATPIPRTLHMAMLGLRDISSLTTPPLDRRSVVTEVLPHNEKRIARAIERELNREGQVFIVNNRVHNIKTVADDIKRLAPDARVIVGHGQMPERELEDVMRRFVTRQADVLVATTIIESGIDIPTANTMIILDADIFGLADLHQLRGRVGRYKHRAYCYMILPKSRVPTERAVKRLRAIEEFSMLGAGFKIAMRDLEIRGAGNLLGSEQSGHIAAVGYDMYCRLLEETAHELRDEPTLDTSFTTIELGVSASIPRAFIPSQRRRLEAYRRLAAAHTIERVREVEKDIRDAYGELPRATAALVELAELRVAAAGLGVRSITLRESDVVVRCESSERVEDVLSQMKGSVRTIRQVQDPTSSAASRVAHDEFQEVYYRPPESYLSDLSSLLGILRRRFGQPTPEPTLASG